MVTPRKRARTQTQAIPTPDKKTSPPENADSSGYEKFREQRIKENKERMKKLGILGLSVNPKPENLPPKRPLKNPSEKRSLHRSQSLRRSSRLETMAPVRYAEGRTPKEKQWKNLEIFIPEGSRPEVYTEEHAMLLGDSKRTWTLCVDGYGEDGERIYDAVNGKSCHQCRQKTLGHHTSCSRCNLVQGQLCGDCLYMRYGENVLDANEDPNWICPVCRGICNCSCCRRGKGWPPTGSLYNKVTGLGYKSVAHYLIQTRQAQSIPKDSVGASQLFADDDPQ
ncbi:hypothetical protein Nepgr_004564 [Nepenthes gracilis]|uniref:Zinc-finger domain-containing protein n=1 Tax=Nepenthes gracilis TaxID=150966 RepID=A0AAD3S1N6_NEPGR|nr:hypothetical protein Nepgr_004564 [Nepenthes gracilis]